MTPKLPLARCDACPGRDAPLVPPEPARIRARLVVVGEAPGRQELLERRPFSPRGASGSLLMRAARAMGLQRSEIHLTNAIPCGVKEADMPEARKCCVARLQAELHAAGAPVIMPVGAWALQSTLASSKRPQILRWRGSVNPTAINPPAPAAGSDPADAAASPLQALVTPTVHPAFVLRSPAWAPTFEVDVERIGRYVQGQPFVPPELQPGRRIVIARDLPILNEALSQLAPGDIAFDVETVGLGPTHTALVCFAISDGRLTVVVPWSRGRDGREPWWYQPDQVAGRISSLFGQRCAVTHNGPAFDHIVAGRHGIRIGRWDDSLLATWAVASHMPRGLSACVQTHLDVTAWKEQEDRTADLDRLWIYNARDTLYTALLWRVLKDDVKEAEAA